MKIVQDEQLGVFLFVGDTPDEKKILSGLSALLKPGDKINYCGRKDEYRGSKFCLLKFSAGEQEFDLIGSALKDKNLIKRLRDFCFFSHTGGLVFLHAVQADGQEALAFTAGFCKHCGAALVDFREVEWCVCDACADKCQHQYERGPMHGGGGKGNDFHMGDFCRKCGRPMKEKKDQAAPKLKVPIEAIFAGKPLTKKQVMAITAHLAVL